MIVINARFLTQQITGVQRFAVEISKEIKKSNLPVVFLAPKNIIHQDLAQELDVKVLGKLKGHLWEQLELQAYIFRNNAFLISFCNTAPLFLKNQIVTIHDLAYKVHPDWFSKSFVLIYSFMIPRLVRVSKSVLTVSNVSKKELIDELGVPEKKITVIYNAVASIFKEKSLSTLESRPINDEYILSVSSHHPRKNFERLVKAFKLIKKDNLKLCIIGNVNGNFNSKKLNAEENIVLLENISDEELVAYYKFANLFVFPSLYEGFGIPIIEALSLNTRVCVSDIPVFREICENSNTVYFNPYDINDIKNKIIESLDDNTVFYPDTLSKFSWKRGAINIIKLIREIRPNVNKRHNTKS